MKKHDLERIQEVLVSCDVRDDQLNSIMNLFEDDNKIEQLHDRGGNLTDDLSNEWLEVHSGAQIYPLRTDIGPITMQDIVISLARTTRYNGHTDYPYATAEHSCHLADYVEREGGSAEDCFMALHHDDAEAVVGDLIRPVKRLLPDFSKIEDNVFCSIAAQHGFPNDKLAPWLKDIDSRILCDEKAHLRKYSNNPWAIDHLKPLMAHIQGWDADTAYDQFMQRHDKFRVRKAGIT